MRLSAGFRLAVIGMVGLGVLAEAYALPTTVFVFNRQIGPRSNGFDNNGLGFILQELGLLDADGHPNIPEAQKIKDAGGNVIGYKSADGTREAYDVNSGATTDQAWQRVEPGGMLHIIKHGAKTRNAGVIFRGGGITLDGDRVFDGFEPTGAGGTGTGAGFLGPAGVPSGPYPLTPRPGANITLNVNGCWTSNDPDGAGPIVPVTATGGGVPGVGGTQGEPNEVGTQVEYILVGGTAAQRAAALERLRQAARAAGYPPPPAGGGPQGPTTDDDIGDYISDLSIDTRRDRIQQIVDAGNPPTIRVRFRYRKIPGAQGGGGFASTSHCPQQIPPAGGDFVFDYINGDPQELIAASLHVPSGALSWPAIFLISMQGELPIPPPAGMVLASGAFVFQVRNGTPVVAPIQMRFGVYALMSQSRVFWYDEQLGQWRDPVGTVSANGQAVTITSANTGLYAAFAPASTLLPLPGLSRWAVIIMMLLLLASGSAMLLRVNRRRAPHRL